MNPDPDLMDMFNDACRDGNVPVVINLLANRRVTPITHNLYDALRNNHVEIVELLLNDGRIDPGSFDNVALRAASASGYLDIVNLLLEDPRVNLINSLTIASENGQLNVVNRLLEDSRVNPTFENNEAIINASENGHINVVNRLLEDPRVDWNDETFPDRLKLIINNKRNENKRRIKEFKKVNLPNDISRKIFKDFIERFGKKQKSKKKKSKKFSKKKFKK